MKTIFHDVLVKRAISPQLIDNTTVNGETIDTASYEGVAFECLIGATDITATLKVQHGNQSDASDMADVTGLSQAIAATDDNKPTVLDLKPQKRYARVVAVVADGTVGAYVSAVANLYKGRVVPVTQDLGGAFVAPAGVVA